ncbi:MAG TPA: hypothetical protein EYH11_03030 [Sulfurimonas autotrophica]|nr:hypothetical protein [Sulfurimonas autotrophica]
MLVVSKGIFANGCIKVLKYMHITNLKILVYCTTFMVQGELVSLGCTISNVALDGKRSLHEAFEGVPI